MSESTLQAQINALKTQLGGVEEWVKKTKALVENIESNLDKDREDFQEQRNKFAHWETQMKIHEEMVNKLPQIIKEKVNEALKPLHEEIQNFKDVIEDKKVVAVNKLKVEEQKKKHWWEFWK